MSFFTLWWTSTLPMEMLSTDSVIRGMVPESWTERISTWTRLDWPCHTFMNCIIGHIASRSDYQWNDVSRWSFTPCTIINIHTDLFKLKDSSCAHVLSWLNLHRHKLSSIIQLQDLHPELQPAGHFTPPAHRTMQKRPLHFQSQSESMRNGHEKLPVLVQELLTDMIKICNPYLSFNGISASKSIFMVYSHYSK